jgi:hypothetical protein
VAAVQSARRTGFQGKPWARGGLWSERGTWRARWPAPAYGAAGGLGAGRRGEGDGVEGSFVINSKCKCFFVNQNFLPIAKVKRKTFEYQFCLVFRDLQLLFQVRFSFEQRFESYLIISKTAN